MNKMDKYKVKEDVKNNDVLEFVSAVITNKEGKVLLLERSKDLKLDPGKYDMVSGHMKKGEFPAFSMLRELKEELDISQNEIESLKYIDQINTPHKKLSNTKCHMYHITLEFTEEEINEKIHQIPNGEIVEAKYLENINVLRNILIKSNLIRTEYTPEVERVLTQIEKRIEISNSKEEKCEEK